MSSQSAAVDLPTDIQQPLRDQSWPVRLLRYGWGPIFVGAMAMAATYPGRTHGLRILKPNGRLLVRILSGDQAHSSPKLTGSGAPIQFVPAKDDIVRLIADANLSGIRLLKYDDPPCFVHEGVTMRETHIEAFRA